MNTPRIIINNYYFCHDSASPQGMGGARHIGFRALHVSLTVDIVPTAIPTEEQEKDVF